MSLNDFELTQCISQKDNCSTYIVKNKKNNQIYILKSFLLYRLTSEEKKTIITRIKICSSLNHKNIISFKETFLDHQLNTLNLIMEFAEGGDLSTKINKLKSTKKYFTEKFIWKTLIQILIAINYLHKKGIIHHDLTSSDIYFKSEIIKIGKLVTCNYIKKIAISINQIKYSFYTAPEILEKKSYDFKCDIWSIGCIIYEMASLDLPFKGDKIKILYNNIKKGKRPKIPKKYSIELQSVINNILIIDPTKRPSAEELLGSYIIKQKIIELTIDCDNSSEIMDINENDVYMSNNDKYIKNILPRNNYSKEENIENIFNTFNFSKSNIIKNNIFNDKNLNISKYKNNNSCYKGNYIHKTNSFVNDSEKYTDFINNKFIKYYNNNIYRTLNQRNLSLSISHDKIKLNKSCSNIHSDIEQYYKNNTSSQSGSVINNNVINILTNKINFKNTNFNILKIKPFSGNYNAYSKNLLKNNYAKKNENHKTMIRKVIKHDFQNFKTMQEKMKYDDGKYNQISYNENCAINDNSFQFNFKNAISSEKHLNKMNNGYYSFFTSNSKNNNQINKNESQLTDFGIKKYNSIKKINNNFSSNKNSAIKQLIDIGNKQIFHQNTSFIKTPNSSKKSIITNPNINKKLIRYYYNNQKFQLGKNFLLTQNKQQFKNNKNFNNKNNSYNFYEQNYSNMTVLDNSIKSLKINIPRYNIQNNTSFCYNTNCNEVSKILHEKNAILKNQKNVKDIYEKIPNTSKIIDFKLKLSKNDKQNSAKVLNQSKIQNPYPEKNWINSYKNYYIKKSRNKNIYTDIKKSIRNNSFSGDYSNIKIPINEINNDIVLLRRQKNNSIILNENFIMKDENRSTINQSKDDNKNNISKNLTNTMKLVGNNNTQNYLCHNLILKRKIPRNVQRYTKMTK